MAAWREHELSNIPLVGGSNLDSPNRSDKHDVEKGGFATPELDAQFLEKRPHEGEENRPGWWAQTSALTRRSLLNVSRNRGQVSFRKMGFRIFFFSRTDEVFGSWWDCSFKLSCRSSSYFHFVTSANYPYLAFRIGICLGLAFLTPPETPGGIQSLKTIIYQSTPAFFYLSIIVSVFIQTAELAVFDREKDDGLYSTIPWVVANFFSYLPQNIVFPTIYSLIIYSM